jgi:allantoin racemase
MRIKICIPVTDVGWVGFVKGQAEEVKDPGTEVDVVNVEKGPESLESSYDDAWAAIFQMSLLEKAEEEGYDAAITYCFCDPVLRAAKEKLSIPVLGIHEPAIHLACMLGSRFSIVGVGGKPCARYLEDIVRGYGLEDRLASVRTIEKTVVELGKDKRSKELEKLLIEEAKEAVESDGADVIVLGCGGMSEFSETLEKQVGVPVIDGGKVAVKLAEDLVKLKLSQSKKAFPTPYPKKRIV